MAKPTLTATWQASHRLARYTGGFLGFTEGLGNPADSSPIALSPTLVSFPSWVATPDGYGVQLIRATTQYIDLGANIAPAALPVSFFVRFKTGTLALTFERIFRSASNQKMAGVWLEINSGDQLQAGFGDNVGLYGYRNSVVDTPLSSNTWYNCLVVITSNSDIRVYLNGTLPAATYSSDLGTVYAKGTGNSCLGRLSYGVDYYYANVTIDAFGLIADKAELADAVAFNANPWGVIRDLAADQLAADKAAVNANVAKIKNGQTVLTGTNAGTLVSTDPGIANVRDGTSYTIESVAKEGTLAVPDASLVSYGVSVDATTGTAILTAQNVADSLVLGALNELGDATGGPKPMLLAMNGAVGENTLPGLPIAINGINGPAAVYAPDVGRTYYVWEGAQTDAASGCTYYLAYWDHARQARSQVIPIHSPHLEYDGDSHGCPCIALDVNNRIVIFGGAHDSPLQMWLSANAHDITSMALHGTIGASYTYSQAYYDSRDEKVHVLTRDSSASPNFYLVHFTWDGTTLSSATQIVNEAYGKLFFDSVHGVAHIIFSGDFYDEGWSGGRNNVFYAKSVDWSTWTTSGGTPYSLPISEDTGEKIFDSASELNCNPADGAMAFKSSGHPMIVFNSGFSTWFMHYNGSTWVSNEISTPSPTVPINMWTPVAFGNRSVANPDTAFSVFVGEGGAVRGGPLNEYHTTNCLDFTLAKTITAERVGHIESVYNSGPDQAFEIIYSGGEQGPAALYAYGRIDVSSPVTAMPLGEAILSLAQMVAALATASGLSSVPDAFLDMTNAIDGKSLRQALRYIAAIAVGVVDGAGTGQETFKGLDGLTNRVRVVADAAGNRTNVEYDPE
jgi:hypothetical protein